MARFHSSKCASRLSRLGGLLVLTGVFLTALTLGKRPAYFALYPASFPDCHGPNIVAHVRWDATSRTRRHIRIYVYKVGNPPKLWYEGAPAGEMDTGKWVADGSTFDLRDHHDQLLARRTMQSTVCE
jgi:hypothetical protein